MLSALIWNVALTAVLAVGLTLASRFSGWMRRRPGVLHVLWLLVLLKLITPPLFLVPIRLGTANRVVEAPTESVGTVGSRAAGATTTDELRLLDNASGLVKEQQPAPEVTGTRLRGTLSPRGHRAVQCLVAAWAIGSVVLLALVIWQVVRWHWLLNLTTPATGVIAGIQRELAESLNLVRAPRLRIANGVFSPCLWNWGRATILLPRELVSELSRLEMRAVIGHELAHLVRGDHWANAFVLLVKLLMWWNPVVWWAHRQVRIAQDLCCDAMTIERHKVDRHCYATTVLRVVEFVQPRTPIGPVVGFATVSPIQERFRMIADTQLTHIISRPAWVAVAAWGIALACAPIWGQDESSDPVTSDPVRLIAEHAPAKTDKADAKSREVPDGEEQLERWFRYYQQYAQSLEMRPDAQTYNAFRAVEEPVFRYTNLNYFSKSHGGLFIWTLGGRPEAVGAIWSNLYAGPGKRYVVRELHSLSLTKFKAIQDGQVVWMPRSAGIELQVIPQATLPARSPELRLVQMRELAHSFAAYRTRGQEERLRLMEQPLYRYDVVSSELLDGALFAFFDQEFWDPEVLMIIEARLCKGEYTWHFAGARLTEGASRLEHQGKDLWDVPRLGLENSSFNNSTDAYFSLRVETRDARIAVQD